MLLNLPPPPHRPTQVAIIAGNFELAEVIKTHKDSDVRTTREFSIIVAT